MRENSSSFRPIERYASGAVACILLIIVAILAGSGCTATINWTGRWEGNRHLKTPSGGNPSIAYTLGSVQLDIDANGHFTMQEAGIPKTGDIRIDQKRAYLHVKTFMGKPISALGPNAQQMNPEIELIREKDGSILLTDPAGFDQSPIRLVKTAKPDEDLSRKR